MPATHPGVPSHTSRLGGWLPSHPTHVHQFLKQTSQEAERHDRPDHPVIREFHEMIESDPVLSMYFTQMFQQQPNVPIPANSGDRVIHSYHEMLRIINHVLQTAPAFDTTGMVGCPINAILDYPMMTPAGLAAFTSPKVNEMFR